MIDLRLENKLKPYEATLIKQCKNDGKTFTLVSAILRLPLRFPNLFHPPWLGPQAIVNSEGVVICEFVNADNENEGPIPFCEIEELVSNLRNLCDHCDISDNDRIAFFGEARKWIARDLRSQVDNARNGRLN